VLEDSADRQLGQQSHGQDHPADDFVGEFAASLIGSAGSHKGLANGLGRDNLFQSRQSIQDPARLIGRQRALSFWHASHSLLAAWVLNKPRAYAPLFPGFSGVFMENTRNSYDCA
jgi:hypothetical protein